jgi:hypothetical protein
MYIYTAPMNAALTPQSLIEQILQIKQMEHGSISTVRQGPNGPFFNLNSWENGGNCCRYLPQEKVPAVQLAIEGYQRYQQLTQEYARQVVEKTRAELGIGVKKKPNRKTRTRRPNSSQPRKPKSSS